MLVLACLVVGSIAISIPMVTGTASAGVDVNAISTVQANVIYDSFKSQNSAVWRISDGTFGPQQTKLLASNVAFTDGELLLKADTGARTGCQYQTVGAYSYGKYKASMKLNLVPGSKLNLFTYSSANGGNMIEYIFETKDGKNYLYFNTKANGRQNSYYTYVLPFDPSADFHTYAFNWNSGRVDFYVDDMSKPVWTSIANVPSQSAYVYFMNWVFGSTSGSSTVSKAYIDWLSIETSTSTNPTPTSTPTVTPKPTVMPTVTPKPTVTPTATPNPTVTPIPGIGEPAPSSKYLLYDNFTSANGQLWSKRSGTWNSSFVYTIFKPELVTFQSGKLVLKAYPDSHTGSEYSGRKLLSYGKYRASIKLDQSSGTYLTFYSYMWATGPNRAGHNEIDVELIRNGGTTVASFTNHVNGVNTHNRYTLPFDPSQSYHVYGYNWYSNKIEYVIDEKVIWTSYTNIPNKPMYAYFQNFVMKNLPSDHKSISTEYVDWVTVEPL